MKRTENELLYMVFMAMHQRCYDENFKQYHDYGGRGIKVDLDTWPANKTGFQVWKDYMGPRPRDQFGQPYEIDRINNDGDYCPGNVQWLDKASNLAKRKKFKQKVSQLSVEEQIAKRLANRKKKYLKNHGTLIGFEEGKRRPKGYASVKFVNPDLFTVGKSQ